MISTRRPARGQSEESPTKDKPNWVWGKSLKWEKEHLDQLTAGGAMTQVRPVGQTITAEGQEHRQEIQTTNWRPGGSFILKHLVAVSEASAQSCWEALCCWRREVTLSASVHRMSLSSICCSRPTQETSPPWGGDVHNFSSLYTLLTPSGRKKKCLNRHSRTQTNFYWWDVLKQK